MQRFLIPIIIINLVSWGVSSYMVLGTPPQNDLWVLLFLATLLVSTNLSLGLAVYRTRRHFNPGWSNHREILRESLTLSFPFSMAISFYLLLRYFAIDSLPHIIELIIFTISFEIYLIKKL